MDMSNRDCWPWRSTPIQLLLIVPILCNCGCVGQEFPERSVPKVDSRQLLRPVDIKIHHSTALVRRAAGDDFDGLSVACEAKDRFQDHVKALGTMRFELYSYARSQPANRGPRVGFWPDIRIDSIEAIQQYWDGIWGLYRFNLNWDKPLNPGERFVLEATLTTPEGEQFSDVRTLTVLK